MMHGIWIDSAPSVVLSGMIDRLVDAGFDSVAICSSHDGGDFPRWRQADAKEVCLRAMAADLEVTATVWLPCMIERIEDIQDHAEMWADVGARTLELDVEGPWTRASPDQRRHVYDATWPRWRDIGESHDVAIGLTTHVHHIEAKADTRQFVEVSRYAWQCYASDEATTETLVDRIELPTRTIGLGAYGEGRKSLRLSYDAALMASPAEVRWWSSRHVVAGRMMEQISRLMID